MTIDSANTRLQTPFFETFFVIFEYWFAQAFLRNDLKAEPLEEVGDSSLTRRSAQTLQTFSRRLYETYYHVLKHAADCYRASWASS